MTGDAPARSLLDPSAYICAGQKLRPASCTAVSRLAPPSFTSGGGYCSAGSRQLTQQMANTLGNVPARPEPDPTASICAGQKLRPASCTAESRLAPPSFTSRGVDGVSRLCIIRGHLTSKMLSQSMSAGIVCRAQRSEVTVLAHVHWRLALAHDMIQCRLSWHGTACAMQRCRTASMSVLPGRRLPEHNAIFCCSLQAHRLLSHCMQWSISSPWTEQTLMLC